MKKTYLFCRLLAVVVLLSLAANTANAATNFARINKVSYALFEKKSWQKLIDFTTKAIDQGTHAKNIYYRRAIAYYNLEQYRQAAQDFEKVAAFDTGDVYVYEYLYYSYFYNREYNKAQAVIDRKPKAAVISLVKDQPLKIISHVLIEGGVETYSYDSDVQPTDLGLAASETTDSYRKPTSYIGIDLGQQWNYRWTSNLYFNQLSLEKSTDKTSQTQIHAATQYFFANSFELSAGASQLSTEIKSDIAAIGNSKTDTSVTSIGARYYGSLFRFGLEGGNANLNQRTQSQLMAKAGIHHRFWDFDISYATHSETATATEEKRKGNFTLLSLYLKPWTAPIALSADYYSGDVYNFFLSNGKTVNNSADLTNSYAALNIDWNITSQFHLYLYLRQAEKTGGFWKKDFTALSSYVGFYWLL